MGEDIKCSSCEASKLRCTFCGASLLNDDAEMRGILQAENDNLRKQLEVAMKGINEIINRNLPYYVTDIAKHTKAEINDIRGKNV